MIRQFDDQECPPILCIARFSTTNSTKIDEQIDVGPSGTVRDMSPSLRPFNAELNLLSAKSKPASPRDDPEFMKYFNAIRGQIAKAEQEYFSRQDIETL